MPKGMTAPDLSGSPLTFDIDAADAPAILETLSEGLQATICASPEWQERIAKSTAPHSPGADPAPLAASMADFEDDIPF
jgi:hypothetical protein